MFYDTLKKLCEEKNISPSKAATECGISRSTVTWWKQHKTSPNSEQVSKLAEYFGVSTDYLLGNEQKEKAPSLDEKKPEVLELLAEHDLRGDLSQRDPGGLRYERYGPGGAGVGLYHVDFVVLDCELKVHKPLDAKCQCDFF